MSEKEKLEERSDVVATVDSTCIDIFVDLDNPRTKKSVERNAGLSLVKVCVVQGGRKVHAWLHIEGVGFDLDESRGFNLVLHVARNDSAMDVKVPVKMKRHGFKLED